MNKITNPCTDCLVDTVCENMCKKAAIFYKKNVVRANPDYRERRVDDQYVEIWTTTSNYKYTIERPIGQEKDDPDSRDYMRSGEITDLSSGETPEINENTKKEKTKCQTAKPKKSNTLKDSISACCQFLKSKIL